MSAAMPTRKIKKSERRRCAKACENCKRRKERCDGSHPCGRCRSRHVSDCSFTSSPRPLNFNPNPASTGPESRSPGDHSHPNPESLSRSTSNACNEERVIVVHPDSPPSLGPNDSSNTPIPPLSRLVQDGPGKIMFIGDSANLAFLQVIRRLVRGSLGPCPFVQDPFGQLLVETTPLDKADWIFDMVNRPPPRPEVAEAEYLIGWYLRATNGLFHLYNPRELHEAWSQWAQAIESGQELRDASASFFLIFAIGAQTCRDDRDEVAERYFNYGRFLSWSSTTGDPDTWSVQANILIAMYLLGASRRNAAFMYLGAAVRAAYALGIHRSDINALFGPADCTARERLWKALRILDLFMSASLGRPPSTHETRDTSAEAHYSAANDLCFVFEEILTDVYSKRMVSTDMVERISEHHRQWAQKYHTGLATDDIQPSQFIQVDGGVKAPNIGLLYVKEAYYWTIMLLARPFLVESISRHLAKAAVDGSLGAENRVADSPSELVVAHACVDSAVRTVDLLRVLETSKEVPKRLPFVVNSLFIAALVLGLAQFGDMDRLFPIESSLASARALLAIFSPHDAVARRNLDIVDNLRAACRLYLDKMDTRRMERQSKLIAGLFGTVHGNSGTDDSAAGERESHGEQDGSRALGHGDTHFIEAGNFPNFGDGNSLPSIGSGTDSMINLSSGSQTSDLQAFSDLIFPMSPRTLLFESFDKDIPLFLTVDARQSTWDAMNQGLT